MTETLNPVLPGVAALTAAAPGARLRMGSLCSGYGGLDMAVAETLGADVAWHCQYDPVDRYQYAARILEQRFPGVPNHGDITAVDYAEVEPVEILTAGFPCQDLSLAGKRAGLVAGRLLAAGQMPCGDCCWGQHDPVTCTDRAPLGVPCELSGFAAGAAAGQLDARDLADPAGPPPERTVGGTRSGLWFHVARAVEVLRPKLVVIENVPGLLSTEAVRGVGSGGGSLDQDAAGGATLRALGCVLGDLADLGFDAEWQVLRAADVGACHQRARVILLAWPAADADHEGGERPGGAGREQERHAAGDDRPAAHAEGAGREGRGVRGHAADRGPVAEDADVAARGERRVAAPGQAEGRGARAHSGGRGGVPAAGGRAADGVDADAGRAAAADGAHGAAGRAAVAAADADGDAVRLEPVPDARRGGPAVAGRSGAHAAADADGGGLEGDPERDSRPQDGQPERHALLDADRRDVRGPAAADAEGDGRGQGRPESARLEGGPDAPLGGGADRAGAEGADPAGDGARPGAEWNEYADAIHRWEAVTGAPAPGPVDDRGRLSSRFVEWMMGLPAGHVTDVPGLPRSAQLKALGNGVVPRQAAVALRLLLRRAGHPLAARLR